MLVLPYKVELGEKLIKSLNKLVKKFYLKTISHGMLTEVKNWDPFSTSKTKRN